jgi:hypothetical protein
MKKSRIASPLTPLLATALFALPGVVRAADSIRWTDSYALAQKIAAQEGKPIWIAYTARRPYAEDPWAKGTLKDKRCHELLRGFVPVLAGPFADGFGRPSRSEKSAAKIWAELLEPVFKTGAGSGRLRRSTSSSTPRASRSWRSRMTCVRPSSPGPCAKSCACAGSSPAAARRMSTLPSGSGWATDSATPA